MVDLSAVFIVGFGLWLLFDTLIVFVLNEQNWRGFYLLWSLILIANIVATPIIFFSTDSVVNFDFNSVIVPILFTLFLDGLYLFRLREVILDLMRGTVVIQNQFRLFVSSFRYFTTYSLECEVSGKKFRLKTSLIRCKELFTTDSFQLLDWKKLPPKELRVTYLASTKIVVGVNQAN